MINSKEGSIRDAGMGGFRWRDETIKEELDHSHSYKAPLVFTWGVQLLLLVGLIYFTFTFNPFLTVGLIALLPLALNKEENGWHYLGLVTVCYPIFVYLLSENNHIWVFWTLSFLTIYAVVITACDTRRITIMLLYLITALYAFLPDVMMVVIGALVCVAGTILAMKASQLNYHVWTLLGKDRELEEPVRLPLFVQRKAQVKLKKKLRKGSNDIANRHNGSKAERVTAYKLQDLPQSFTYHDIPLPGADVANIDHLLICPQGVFVVDTKRYGGAIKKDGSGVISRYSDTGKKLHSLDSIGNQMLWALDSMKVEVPPEYRDKVKCVVTVQQAFLDDIVVYEQGKKNKVGFVPFEKLVPIISDFPVILSGKDMEAIAQSIDSVVEGKRPVYSENGWKNL